MRFQTKKYPKKLFNEKCNQHFLIYNLYLLIYQTYQKTLSWSVGTPF